MSLELFVRGLYTRASPLLQLGFHVLSRIVSAKPCRRRIRRRIFVRRKSAEKVRLAEYAIYCQLAKFSSRKIGRKYVIRGLCAS